MLHITPSERRALQLLAQEHSPTDVAAGLGISSRETEAMLARLFGAMGAATAIEAVAVAHRRGLLADGHTRR
jgi:DNA-binding CsgD family transcriptional regulator